MLIAFFTQLILNISHFPYRAIGCASTQAQLSIKATSPLHIFSLIGYFPIKVKCNLVA